MRNKNFIVVNLGKRKIVANKLTAIIKKAGNEMHYGGLLLSLGVQLPTPKEPPWEIGKWMLMQKTEPDKDLGWQGVSQERDDMWLMLRRECGEDIYIPNAIFAFDKIGKKSL